MAIQKSSRQTPRGRLQRQAHGSENPASADALRQSFDRDFDRLAANIQKLRIDSQRFLAGDLKIPPDELRDRITADLRRLRGSNLKATADNFRLSSLEAQFNSLVELFGRRMRELEEAGPRRDASSEAPPDPEKGVVIGSRPNTVAVNALYQGLYLRSKTRQPTMDLERFRSYLGRQAEAIRAKTGCDEIVFRVAEDQGKLKLKAKPVRRKAT